MAAISRSCEKDGAFKQTANAGRLLLPTLDCEAVIVTVDTIEERLLTFNSFTAGLAVPRFCKASLVSGVNMNTTTMFVFAPS
jgi:hypothetical protein